MSLQKSARNHVWYYSNTQFIIVVVIEENKSEQIINSMTYEKILWYSKVQSITKVII